MADSTELHNVNNMAITGRDGNIKTYVKVDTHCKLETNEVISREITIENFFIDPNCCMEFLGQLEQLIKRYHQ